MATPEQTSAAFVKRLQWVQFVNLYQDSEILKKPISHPSLPTTLRQLYDKFDPVLP